jgi:nucleoside-diphosphate-sugar epimerase
MKKVLVTGAAGCLGKQVIKYLLSEGKYEITALDLKNKKSYKTLKKYSRRINIVYGDTTDPILIDELIKNNDYIIHLANVKVSLSLLKEKISKEIDYKGSENIIRAINFYNPKCFLIYPSTTVVYGKKNKPVSISDKLNNSQENYYVKNKIETEKLIKNKLTNYVIYRIPTVLSNLKKEDFIYNTPLNNETEFISASDAAYAIVKTIDYKSEVNKKIFNLSGGKTCTSNYSYVLKNILKIRGLSFQYIWSLLFLEKNMYGNTFADSNKLENILHFQSESLESYFMKLKRNSKYRWINKLLAKPFIYFIKRKEN